jgi:hypothetical protein
MRLDKRVFSYTPKCHVLGEDRPLRRAFSLVKPTQSDPEEVQSPSGRQSRDINFLKFAPKRPSRYTSTIPHDPGGTKPVQLG